MGITEAAALVSVRIEGSSSIRPDEISDHERTAREDRCVGCAREQKPLSTTITY